MNLLDDEEGTLKALVELEGERWLERQKRGDFKGQSVFDAIVHLRGLAVRDPEVSIPVVIYGHDGWNRYRVTTTGEVQFIGLQAWGKEVRERAKELGFEIV